MRRRSHRLRQASALVALACWAASPLVAPAGASASARLHPTAAVANDDAARTTAYWTRARMQGAEPLDTPAESPLALASFAAVATPTVPPFAVNGRLFVVQGGKQGYCSATAINSASRRLVLTAAHCLNSGPRFGGRAGVWSRYVEFVPAFSGGTAPFGAFPAGRSAIYTPRQWARFGNPNFDIGAVLTSANAEGLNVADVVGGATIVADASRRQQFQTFGYPGRSTSMQACESPYVGDDPLTYRIPGPPTMAIRCHWAPGASGGGWLTEEGRAINGVTSYGKRRDRIHTFSPYFSSRNVGRLTAGM